MKVFVTIGTTPFPELLAAIKEQSLDEKFDMAVQAAQGDISTFKNGFCFTEDIQYWYDWADVVITHAGAGSVYRLLESKKRLIVVPNLYRKDKHQQELANFVKQGNYALTCSDLADISALLVQMPNHQFSDYIKEPFHGVEDIISTLY